MKSPKSIVIALASAMVILVACGRPTGVPQASSGNTQQLPFDRESRSGGVMPTKSLVPPATRLPQGTSIAVKLEQSLSSASAQTGDSFEGTLDEPVVVEGQPLISRGASVSGRVLAAKHSSGKSNPGYLRIALVSVDFAGKDVLIDTSSIFVKAGARGSSKASAANSYATGASNEVVFTPERKLTFRLAQAVDLQ